MRRLSVFLLLLIMAAGLPAGNLRGQCSSCGEGVKVRFRGGMCADGPVSITLADKTLTYNAGGCGLYSKSGEETAMMEPEVEYSLLVSGVISSIHVELIVPDCFDCYIDGEKTTSIDLTAGGCGSYTQDWDVILKFKPVGDSGSAGSGEVSSGSSAGGVAMNLSLGGLSNGSSAGAIRLASGTVSSALFTPAALDYAKVSSEVEVIRASGTTGPLRQIRGPETLADIVTLNATSYEIRFYPPDRIGSKSGAFYTIINPSVPAPEAWRVTGLSAAEVQIVELNNNVQVGVKTFSYVSGTGTWLMTSGGDSETRVETTLSGGDRQIDITWSNAAGTAQSTREIYHEYAWGWEKIKHIEDPAGANLVTESIYYDNSSLVGPGGYGKLKWVINPDGSWEKYDYYDYTDEYGNQQGGGKIFRVYRPWMDLPALPSSALTSNSKVTEYHYSGLGGVLNNEISLIKEYVPVSAPAKLIRQTEYEHSSTSRYVLFNGNNVIYPVIEKKQLYRDENDTIVSGFIMSSIGTASAVPSVLRGRMLFEERADGTADQYAYQQGTYDYTTGVFSAAAGGNHLQTTRSRLRLIGATSCWERNLTTENSAGVVVFESEQLSVDGTSFVTYEHRRHTYDTAGNLTQTTLNNEVIYSAVWNNGRMDSETDEQGITTEYTLYDHEGRVKTQIRCGVTTNFIYDAAGRLTSTSRSSGGLILTSSAVYDGAGRITSETGEDGQVTGVTYPTARSVTRTRADGSTVIQTSYLDGQKKSVGGSGVVNLYYIYGADTHGFSTIERVGSSVSENYSKTWTNLRGQTHRFARNSLSGLIVKEVKYDPEFVERRISETVPGEAKILFEYYDDGNLGERRRTARDLDGNGAITWGGNEPVDVVRRSFIDISGIYYLKETTGRYIQSDPTGENILSTVRTQLTGLPAGVSSIVTTLDAQGNATTVTTAVNRATRTVTVTTDTPDSTLNAVETIIDGLLRSSRTTSVSTATTYQYDALERPTIVTSPKGVTTVTAYNPVTGRVDSITHAGAVTSYDYHPNNSGQAGSGRVSAETRPDTKVLRTSYTTRGEIYRRWGGADYPVQHTYDSSGNLQYLRTFRGGTGWTGTSWPASPGTSDLTTWSYYSVGFLWRKTDAAARETVYNYHPDGKLHTVQRPRATGVSVTATYTWDSLGRQELVTYSDGTPSVSMTYYRDGRLNTVTDAAGLHTFTYPTLLQTSETITGFAGVLNGVSRSQTLDTYGRLSALGAASGASIHTVGYTYKSDSRPDKVTAGTESATYAYVSASDDVQSVTFRTGTTVRLTSTRSYDSKQRFSGVSHAYGGGAVQSFGVTEFDGMNRRKKIRREDDTRWSFTYNDKGEVLSGVRELHLAPNTAVPGWSHSYTYDEAGNRTGATVNARASVWTPNNLNQITNRTVPRAFDVIGSADAGATVTVNGAAASRLDRYFYREITTASTAAVHVPYSVTSGDVTGSTTRSGGRFLPGSPEPVTWDFDGNLKTDGRFTYTWDAENRLKSMETIAAVPNIAKRKLEFSYDYMNRRVSRKVWTNPTGAAWVLREETKFIHETGGWNIQAEVNAATGLFLRTHAWGTDASGTFGGAGGVGGLLLTGYVPDGSVHACGADLNGNVTLLVSFATGAASAQYDYGPFGEPLRRSGDYAAFNPFRFSSKYTDDDSGLVDFGLRYYSPEGGRWISRDPIEEEGGLNLYGMCGNDGVNNFDLLGMKWKKAPRKQQPRNKHREVWLRGSETDTLEQLATLVELDPAESSKWAKDVGNKKMGDKSCAVSVPNIWIDADLLRGGGFNLYNRIVNMGGTLGRAFTFSGKKEIKVNHAKDLIPSILKHKEDIIGFSLYAHGSPDGAIAMQMKRTGWEKDELGNFLRDKNGKRIGIYDMTRVISQHDVIDAIDQNGFKLSKAYVMQCYSGFKGQYRGNYYDWDHQWRTRVVKNNLKVYQGVNILGIDTKR